VIKTTREVVSTVICSTKQRDWEPIRNLFQSERRFKKIRRTVDVKRWSPTQINLNDITLHYIQVI